MQVHFTPSTGATKGYTTKALVSTYILFRQHVQLMQSWALANRTAFINSSLSVDFRAIRYCEQLVNVINIAEVDIAT